MGLIITETFSFIFLFKYSLLNLRPSYAILMKNKPIHDPSNSYGEKEKNCHWAVNCLINFIYPSNSLCAISWTRCHCVHLYGSTSGMWKRENEIKWFLNFSENIMILKFTFILCPPPWCILLWSWSGVACSTWVVSVASVTLMEDNGFWSVKLKIRWGKQKN